jgi:hypothetical protein
VIGVRIHPHPPGIGDKEHKRSWLVLIDLSAYVPSRCLYMSFFTFWSTNKTTSLDPSVGRSGPSAWCHSSRSPADGGFPGGPDLVDWGGKLTAACQAKGLPQASVGRALARARARWNGRMSQCSMFQPHKPSGLCWWQFV